MDKRLAKIQLILEKTVQALARKIYMEGIVKLATDSRYWDLWDHQKLSSELELKRRHLLELNQELTNQLIDLEKHFNSLELNKFSESAGSEMNPRTMQSKHGSSRYVNSLHSLQNTMSAQLAAAEQLSKCLSKQMAVLSIESPSIKKQNVKRDLFETIGIPYNDASFISPGSERKTSNTSSKQGRLSLSNSVAVKEQSWRKDSTKLKSSEPETARRRRDSLDRNWSSFNPPKTTVKRMLLQDNRQSPKTGRSSFVIDQELFNRELERSAYVAAEPSTSSSATILNSFKGKVTQNATASKSPEIATTLFKTELHNASQPRMNFSPLLSQSTENSGSGLNRFAVNDLKSTKQSEIDLQQTPASNTRFPEKILPSSKKTNIVKNSSDKQIGLSGLTSGNLKYEPIVTESLFSDKSSKTQSSAALAFGSSPSLSYPGTSESNPSQFVAASSSSLSYSSSGSHSVIDLSPPPPKPTSPDLSSTAVSSGSLTINSNASVLKGPLHGSIASASISQPSENVVNSSAAPLNFSYKTPSTEVVEASIETGKKSEMLNSTSNSGLQIGRSDLKLEPPVTSKPTSEVSTSSQSGSQFSYSFSHSATKPDPEQQSPAAVLSSTSLSGLATANDQKIDNSAVIYTQEDEMEEEAPEESRSTELTLGSLGGFGIGNIPTPTTAKSNPFGGAFASTTSPPNPPFSMTVPGGELFKPASFSFPSPQPSQPSQPSNFASFAGGLSSGTTAQVPTGGFGHSAQTGAGQQALGSVLGSFGQSRQLGAGLPGAGIASAGGFGGFSGNQSAGGFVGNQPTGGFSSAAAGGGFASLASAGGGFSGIASAGSGFSGVAPSGSGFSGGGFGGFSAVPPSGSGFGGAPATGGGFGGFSNQGSGGFSSFGGSGGSVRPPPNLLTQMRK